MHTLAVSIANRRQGGLLGLLIGDALGVPYEFHSPQSIPPASQIEYAPPAGFARAHVGTPPGTWSDDGAQALCLLASLLECGTLDMADFGARLLRWQGDGYMAVGNRVYDIGITTARALDNLRRGTAPQNAGLSGETDNGNGSLMRCLPLALWHDGPDSALVRDAHLQSCVTHAHPRSQACCALYCLWARHALRETSSDAWTSAVHSLRDIYTTLPAYSSELETHIRPDDPSPGTGTGYVADCLRSARWCVAQGNAETAIRAAIRLGHDTDTTACVAGGIAGLRGGVAGLPERWLADLRGQDILAPFLDGLTALN